MQTNDDVIQSAEISFGFDELFFSRTDEGGIIRAGNSVFQRVSIYEWDELLDKPHKIVRHPDTPRAVFWQLWDTIRQRRPIGAYVKNRAKDGRYYWVFAIVTPIDGGYLSVRLRPSSALLPTIKHEYETLSDAERRERMAPADSAQKLLGRLAELGFADYPSFMSAALGQELAARDIQLKRQPDPAIAFFQTLVESAQALLTQATHISEAYVKNENVPLNFQVLAAQLGQDGAAIGVISGNYSLISAEMKEMLDQFTNSAREVYRAINEGFFLACTARIQEELLSFFAGEADNAGASREREMALLDHQRRDYQIKALEGLQAIARQAEKFREQCKDMNRLAAGLEVTRIMGKVECSRHAVVKDRLDELLNDLEVFQKAISGGLKEIDQRNQNIQHHTNRLIGEARKAA